MTRRSWIVRAIALSSTLVSLPATAAELTAEAQQRLGIGTQVLAASTRPVQIPATIEVLDPAPLARMVEDLATAEVTAAASAAEARRTDVLFHADTNVAAKVVEAARTQAVVDAAHVRQLRTDLTLAWGKGLAQTDTAAMRRTVDGYVAGDRVLLRAQPLQSIATIPTNASLNLPETGEVDAKVLGRLPQSSTGIAPEWLLEAVGTRLAVGMHTTGNLRLDERGVSGLLIPREAILRWNGLTWVYVQVDPTHFEHRAIRAIQRVAEGWLIEPQDLHAGDRVVVTGAAALLAVDAGTPAAD
jgi:hypothetical protein